MTDSSEHFLQYTIPQPFTGYDSDTISITMTGLRYERRNGVDTMRMILLGVGTAVPDADRDYTHMVWKAPDGAVLIDAGGSTYQRLLRAGVNPHDLRALILTHSHADHVNGLPGLLFSLKLSGYNRRLVIYGNAPTLMAAQRIVEAFDLGEYQPDVDWTPIEAGDEIVFDGAAYRIRTAADGSFAPMSGIALRQRGWARAGLFRRYRAVRCGAQPGARRISADPRSNDARTFSRTHIAVPGG
jgi:hypothetical protein